MSLGAGGEAHLEATSIPSWPYTSVSPRHTPLSQNSLYLVYKHTASGQYSLVVHQCNSDAALEQTIGTDYKKKNNCIVDVD